MNFYQKTFNCMQSDVIKSQSSLVFNLFSISPKTCSHPFFCCCSQLDAFSPSSSVITIPSLLKETLVRMCTFVVYRASGSSWGRGSPCSQHIMDGGFLRQSYWPNCFPATLSPIDALLELVSCSLSMDTACDTWQVCITPVPRDALDPRTFQPWPPCIHAKMSYLALMSTTLDNLFRQSLRDSQTDLGYFYLYILLVRAMQGGPIIFDISRPFQN